jgi:hydrogenase nickel incorporation protein HypB
MCETCGCSDEGGARIEGEHTHVLADGTVVTHLHGHEHGHEHAGGHGHGHEHEHEHEHGKKTVQAIEVDLLAKNRMLAAENRGWFAGREVLAVNLMSSPGSGKTALLEKTLRELGEPVAVLEGDQETTRDAERIRATGTAVVQINTGKGCHLEADMVRRGLDALRPVARSVLFIENVGNLVCPALFDLGEDARVVLLSVTEGEDKPLKYPHMFQAADLVLLTKIDLLPHLEFDVAAVEHAIADVAPSAAILHVSSRTGEGMEAWFAWLRARRMAHAGRRDDEAARGISDQAR